eukprot:CAMPEP_0172733710 /NCGR_PEP_ID=MMETSP1074-20121228/107860_1 /TAXON_ID=2916 /ORGANISM="Ceratium fusus, Strain PA161109" /LENGTH=61 /DNA_ID=CAMNT_0013562323 /DNA_START=117 /DNA_END=299 /DNA_ORIENTATION=+
MAAADEAADCAKVQAVCQTRSRQFRNQMWLYLKLKNAICTASFAGWWLALHLTRATKPEWL